MLEFGGSQGQCLTVAGGRTGAQRRARRRRGSFLGGSSSPLFPSSAGFSSSGAGLVEGLGFSSLSPGAGLVEGSGLLPPSFGGLGLVEGSGCDARRQGEGGRTVRCRQAELCGQCSSAEVRQVNAAGEGHYPHLVHLCRQGDRLSGRLLFAGQGDGTSRRLLFGGVGNRSLKVGGAVATAGATTSAAAPPTTCAAKQRVGVDSSVVGAAACMLRLPMRSFQL